MEFDPPSTTYLRKDLAEKRSLLVPVGYRASSCGYCNAPGSNRTPNSAANYAILSERVNVDDYQEMLDRGWRRSGSGFYKTDQRRSCCPHYTIRIPMAEFKPSREQRHTLHRWNRFVLGDEYLEGVKKLYPPLKEEKKKSKNGFDLLQTVHASEYKDLKRPPEPAHRFEVALEPDTYTDEKYRLFQQYQRLIHKERPSDISKNGFKHFLCSSTLTSSENGNSERPCLGSFHQLYRLDGKLIAMGVLDFLPKGVSAVYFIYDADYEDYSPGKLSALREASLALEGGYEFYSMGFYIHSCPKMRYKAEFRPQYILDPESNVYYPLNDDVKAKLDNDKYLKLSPPDTSAGSPVDDMSARELRLAFGRGHFLSPVDAARSKMTTMFLRVPGVVSAASLSTAINLDHIWLSLEKDLSKVVQAQDTVFWYPPFDGTPLEKVHTGKGIVYDLAATVGPVVANRMVVDCEMQ